MKKELVLNIELNGEVEKSLIEFAAASKGPTRAFSEFQERVFSILAQSMAVPSYLLKDYGWCMDLSESATNGCSINIPYFVQYRFPRSKKRRIRDKWKKDLINNYKFI